MKYIKKYCFVVFVTMFFVSCKKNNQLKQLVSQIVGTYYTTEICETGAAMGAFYDTVYNVPLVVTSIFDTVLVINGNTLYFNGNISDKSYSFSVADNYAKIDPNLKNISYIDLNAYNYLSCSYSGTK